MYVVQCKLNVRRIFIGMRIYAHSWVVNIYNRVFLCVRRTVYTVRRTVYASTSV